MTEVDVVTVLRHCQCPACGYSGATRGHATFVKAGAVCHNCAKAEYVDYVPHADLQGAIGALRKIAERRPSQDDAAAAFYRCRQDARSALASLTTDRGQ